MQKKGIQHVEIILAFVLFISITSIAFYYFSPFDRTENFENTLKWTYENLIKNTSVSVEKYSVVIDSSKVKGDSVGVWINKPIGNFMKIRVSNPSGEVLNSRIENYEIGEIIFDWSSESGKIIYVYLSEDFDESGLSPVSSEKEDAGMVSSLYESKIISEKRFRALLNRYNADYQSLKEELNIPRGKEFGFEIGEIKTENKIPQNNNVIINNEKVEFLHNEGNVDYENMKIIIW